MSRALASSDTPVELVNDPGHVYPGFAVGGDSVPSIDGTGSRVVCRQRESKIIVVALQERIEVRGAPVDILSGGEGIDHAEIGGS